MEATYSDLKRSLGNASAVIAAKMVAGAKHNGGFTDHKVVILFEHRVAQAKRSRAHKFSLKPMPTRPTCLTGLRSCAT